MLINSRENPKIKLYKKLSAGRKTRDENGLFTVEGARICVDAAKEAANGNIKIHSVFYTEKAIEKYSEFLDTKLLFECAEDNRIYEVTEEIAGKMSEEGTSQGIFLIAYKLDKKFSCENIDGDGKYLIADNLQDPGNLGTLLRTADAVGVNGVVLTGNCVDLYNPKVVRSTMGSMPRLNIFIENDFEKVMSIFGRKGIKVAAAVVSGGKSVSEYDFSKSCAVVIGNEGRGIPQQHIEMCNDKITIKMHGHIESLNAAAAGTIILWEMFR